MNRRKFLDWLKIGGAAAVSAPVVGKAKSGELPPWYVTSEGCEAWAQTIEPGEKYIVGNDIFSVTAMSAPVIKWSKVNDAEKW